MVRVTVSEARKAFSDTLNRVACGGERIVLHRGGKDVVAIVPIEDLRLLEQLEDAMDLGLVRKTLAETRETMSWETLKEELGLQALRGKIQKGIDQAEAGELLDGPETMRKIRESIEGKKL
jgi:prevent-host-death family protein